MYHNRQDNNSTNIRCNNVQHQDFSNYIIVECSLMNSFNSLDGNQVDSVRSSLRNFRLNIDRVVDDLMWFGNALHVFGPK